MLRTFMTDNGDEFISDDTREITSIMNVRRRTFLEWVIQKSKPGWKYLRGLYRFYNKNAHISYLLIQNNIKMKIVLSILRLSSFSAFA